MEKENPQCWVSGASPEQRCVWGAVVRPIARIDSKEFVATILNPEFRSAYPDFDFSLNGQEWEDDVPSHSWDGNGSRGELYHRLTIGEQGSVSAFLLRDCAGISLQLWDQTFQTGSRRRPLLKLDLRDRTHDGTRHATPPSSWWTTGEPADACPPGNHRLGLTGWGYSNPSDQLPPQTKAVELSFYSGNPNFGVQKFWEDVRVPDSMSLTNFTVNPFDELPNQPDPEKIDQWLGNFRYILNGLIEIDYRNGIHLPFPGQYATRSINGGVVKNFERSIEPLLKAAGFTHTSLVPTWPHIWRQHLLESDFRPHNAADADAVDALFQAIGEIDLQGVRVSSLPDRLKFKMESWVAQASVMARRLEEFGFIPEEHFDRFGLADLVLRNSDRSLVSWPLKPGYNIWLMKEL